MADAVIIPIDREKIKCEGKWRCRNARGGGENIPYKRYYGANNSTAIPVISATIRYYDLVDL